MCNFPFAKTSEQHFACKVRGRKPMHSAKLPTHFEHFAKLVFCGISIFEWYDSNKPYNLQPIYLHSIVAEQLLMSSDVILSNTYNDAGKTCNVQLSTSSSTDHTSTAANNSEDMDESTIIINNSE